MIPTFIELNPTELCNLQCSFCPRSQDYPNQNLHMDLDTVDKIIEHCHELMSVAPRGYVMTLSNTGRGEPVLHKHFREMMEKLIKFSDQYGDRVRLLVNTNGYKFDDHIDIFKRTDDVAFNVYYNYTFEEYENFLEKYRQYSNITVRRRKEGEESEQVNYNARSGAIINDLTNVIWSNLSYRGCQKPFRNIFIDWNGDYILCCNDWVIMEPLDNIHNTSILDFYTTNPKLSKYKDMLSKGQRTMSPCIGCNYFDRG